MYAESFTERKTCRFIQRGVKEIQKREGAEATSGRDIKVGKPKTKTSKREIPLNDVAIEMIQDLRNERYTVFYIT